MSSRMGDPWPDCHWAQETATRKVRDTSESERQCLMKCFTCPSPCSKYQGKNPPPAYFFGAKTIARAVFLLYPHFARIRWIEEDCAWSRSFLEKKDCGRVYWILGMYTVLYASMAPCRVIGLLLINRASRSALLLRLDNSLACFE